MRALILATAVIVCASTAYGQEGDAAQAKRRFEAGQVLFKAKDYDGAIAEYKKAYELEPAPLLLFNIAQAYRLKGDIENAYDFYSKFATDHPNAPYIKDAIRWIRVLEAPVRDRRTKRAADERAREAAEKEQAERARQQQQQADLTTPATAAESPSRGLGALGYGGIATAAVGLGLLGVGGYYGLRARSIESDIDAEDERWSDDLLDDFDDGEKASDRMVLFTSLGGGLAVAGAALLVIDLLSNDEGDQGIRVVPSGSPESAGLSVVGRF